MNKIKLEIMKRHVNPFEKYLALEEAEKTSNLLISHFKKIDYM